MATRSCNAVYSSIIGCKTSGNYKELCLIFSSQSITTNQDQMPLFLCSPGKDLNWGLCSHYLFTSFLALGVIQKSESGVQSNSSWNPKVCLRSMQAKKFASDGRISHSEAKERYSLAQDLPQKVSEALLLFHVVMGAYVFIYFEDALGAVSWWTRASDYYGLGVISKEELWADGHLSQHELEVLLHGGKWIASLWNHRLQVDAMCEGGLICWTIGWQRTEGKFRIGTGTRLTLNIPRRHITHSFHFTYKAMAWIQPLLHSPKKTSYYRQVNRLWFNHFARGPCGIHLEPLWTTLNHFEFVG